MISVRRGLVSLVLCVSGGACGDGRTAPPPAAQVTALPPGVVARVGEEDIPAALVSRIAASQRLSPAQARDRAVADALFAAHARERFRGSGRLESAERAAAVRSLLEELKAEAERQGPPTDQEIGALTALRWHELDRPELVRVSHFVVPRPKVAADAPKARALAERLRDVVRGATDAIAFANRVRTVDFQGFKVTVENLLPVAADGRVADPTNPRQTFDPAFAREAHALRQVGDQSAIFESPFGWHVILLEERIEERRVPLEERRTLLRQEVMSQRAQARQADVLRQASSTTPSEVDRGAGDLLLRVQVEQ